MILTYEIQIGSACAAVSTKTKRVIVGGDTPWRAFWRAVAKLAGKRR